MCGEVDDVRAANDGMVHVPGMPDSFAGAVRPCRNLLPLLRLAVIVRGGPEQAPRERIDRRHNAGLRRADHDSISPGGRADERRPLVVRADRLWNRTEHLAPDQTAVL